MCLNLLEVLVWNYSLQNSLQKQECMNYESSCYQIKQILGSQRLLRKFKVYLDDHEQE